MSKTYDVAVIGATDAVGKALDQGLRTPDIMSDGCTEVGTAAMGDAVVDALSV